MVVCNEPIFLEVVEVTFIFSTKFSCLRAGENCPYTIDMEFEPSVIQYNYVHC